ncbi:MAG: hypothetical protein RQ867_02500 [Mariprofundaceae bacterium]|nr:hypothetical protein [Mariprofundaceae bacterium]
MHNILVVCHDAGGAEVVSSWVLRNRGPECSFLLEGPATHVFKRKLGAIKLVDADVLSSAAVAAFDLILTGTGWASDLEKRAVRAGKLYGTPTASFLDHWCNYLPRFQQGDEYIFPDEIWVGDDDACQMARSYFPDEIVRLIPNPYFLDVKEAFEKLDTVTDNSGEWRILYVCEAIAESGRKLPSGELIEYRSLELFFDHLENIIGKSDAVSVRLRPHPAESQDKYSQFLRSGRTVNVELSPDTSLIEDCVWANWIVGMNSMALIIARIGGKRVFYCNLEGAKPKSLPVSGIENFLDTTDLK